MAIAFIVQNNYNETIIFSYKNYLFNLYLHVVCFKKNTCNIKIMKIVHIVPGFGGAFYCGNCLRDSAFMKTVKNMGHTAITIPMYLPLTLNNQAIPNEAPVFFGAVSIYIKQKVKFLKHMPIWLENLLNSPFILRYAAHKAGSTRAKGLEDMTLSMMQGETGVQADELEVLINWLKHHEKPDVVHVSNVLLIGLARRIRNEIGIPVIFSLQDEDVWIDAMDEKYRIEAWQLISERAKDVDAFIAVSNYFADVIKRKTTIPHDKIHVVYVGVSTSEFSPSPTPPAVPTIGYLSRVCEANGFEVVTDAFIELKKSERFKNVLLHVSGGFTGDDKPFINKMKRKFQNAGILEQVKFIPEFEGAARLDFLHGITLLSVPVLDGEAFGLYQIEALATGVPVVQPALGAFPEIAEISGGGVIYNPNNATSLAANWAELLDNPEKIKQLASTGRENTKKHFDTEVKATETIEIYKKVIHAKSTSNI